MRSSRSDINFLLRNMFDHSSHVTERVESTPKGVHTFFQGFGASEDIFKSKGQVVNWGADSRQEPALSSTSQRPLGQGSTGPEKHFPYPQEWPGIGALAMSGPTLTALGTSRTADQATRRPTETSLVSTTAHPTEARVKLNMV